MNLDVRINNLLFLVMIYGALGFATFVGLTLRALQIVVTVPRGSGAPSGNLTFALILLLISIKCLLEVSAWAKSNWRSEVPPTLRQALKVNMWLVGFLSSFGVALVNAFELFLL